VCVGQWESRDLAGDAGPCLGPGRRRGAVT
jgi:hypothetical protein